MALGMCGLAILAITLGPSLRPSPKPSIEAHVVSICTEANITGSDAEPCNMTRGQLRQWLIDNKTTEEWRARASKEETAKRPQALWRCRHDDGTSDRNWGWTNKEGGCFCIFERKQLEAIGNRFAPCSDVVYGIEPTCADTVSAVEAMRRRNEAGTDRAARSATHPRDVTLARVEHGPKPVALRRLPPAMVIHAKRPRMVAGIVMLVIFSSINGTCSWS
jgi:hypothetical protein